MLNLRAPLNADTPATAKRVGAFESPTDVAAKKARAKAVIKYTSPWLPPINCKPGEVESHIVDAWVKEQKAKPSYNPKVRDICLNYLTRGPPFLGISDWKHKDQVKAAGSIWVTNPERSSPKGWWAAKTVENLILLLQLTDDGEGVWTPMAPISSELVLSYKKRTTPVIVQEEAPKQLDPPTLHTATSARKARALLEQQRVVDSGVGEDTAEEKEMLSGLYSIEWTDRMRDLASTVLQLGPQCGLSSVARVLRGLRLRIVTSEQVKSGVYESTKDRDPMSSSTSMLGELSEHIQATQAIQADALGNEFTRSGTNWIFFRKFVTLRPVQHIPNLNVKFDAQETTHCETCRGVVSLQFLDCNCHSGQILDVPTVLSSSH